MGLDERVPDKHADDVARRADPEAAAPAGMADAVAGQIPIRLGEIGERLRAFRMGRGLSPEAVADRIGISRAALYRAEKGKIPKIDTLVRVSTLLGVSLPSLLGVGVEYVDTAVGFFERMRQLEDQSDEVVGLFGPVSYLLTSDAYDAMLREVLQDTLPDDPRLAAEARAAQGLLMEVLQARKASWRKRRPRIVSLISSSDMERFLLHGALGRDDLPAEVVARRRLQARREVEHVAALLRHPPPEVQIGLVLQSTPATTFQIFRQPDRAVLAISPFRLGEQPNVSLGAALITSAEEPMRLHEAIVARLWASALTSGRAADQLDGLIARYGIG
jgi:transcriptional regulator with XRE-family HTH domain